MGTSADATAEVIYARITGPCDESGAYPWAEVADAPGGAWEATGRTGDVGRDPAYEITGERGLDGMGRVFELGFGLANG